MSQSLPVQLVILAVFLVVTFGAAAVGARFQPGEWYTQLVKPGFTPPSWVFGPVWTFLYLCMGIAAWLVWRQAGWYAARWALTLYVMQLVLNALWSVLFFGKHLIGAALVDIIVLLAAIVVTTIMFWRITPPAGWLMIPYVLWVGFASVLNYRFWILN